MKGYEILIRTSKCYRQAFGDANGQRVLADLEKFIKPNEPSYVPGHADQTAYNEGQRRVWLRIQSFLNMDEHDLRALRRRYDEEEASQWPTSPDQTEY